MNDPVDVLRSALADRYVIDREIGRGGMASVLLARDLRHDRFVAMKVIHPEVAAVIGGDRFRREIQIAARLTHRGILAVLDSGECTTADGRAVLWYAMPYVSGDSLRARLTRERQLAVDDAVVIAREVAEVLDYAHREGVVHRDVKPENILLQDGHPLLADFGIARTIDSADAQRLTESGIALGTPAYMSPEQSLGEREIDARSDIYALGCVLYEMLVGEAPFTGPTAQVIIARKLTTAPPAVTVARPLAASIEPVVLKALSRTPADRYATAREMAAALGGASSTPVPLPRARPELRRRRWLRPVVAAATLVLAVVGAAAVWRARSGGTGAGPAANRVARLVVLPFQTTGDSARAYFTEGMTRALRTRLATIPGIELIGGTSAEAVEDKADPAHSARELRAQYALTGMVAWDSAGGGRIRVQPELVSASDGRVALRWPAPVQASTRDVLDVERRITEQIARALDLTIGESVRARLGAGAAVNPAAYEMLLRAESGAAGRREKLLSAVALDPRFGSAWARLGLGTAVTYNEFRDPTEAAQADTFSLKALETAPDLAQSHLARGIYHRSVTMHHDSAIFYLDTAQKLAPGDAEVAHFRASVYQAAGRFNDALNAARRGAGLDLKDPSALNRVARTLAWLRETDKAWEKHLEVRALELATIPPFTLADGALYRMAQGNLAAARAAIATIPSRELRARTIVYTFTPYLLPQVVDDSLLADLCERGEPAWFVDPAWLRQQSSSAATPWSRHMVCTEAARRAGQGARVRAHADSAVRLVRAAIASNPTDNRPGAQYAWALLLRGDTAAAMRQADAALAWRRIDQDAFFGVLNTLWYVQVVALAGDIERALPELKKLLTHPSPVTVAWLRVDPTFNLLRNDPRFTALLAEPERR